MPTIEELVGLYDKTKANRAMDFPSVDVHVAKPFVLSTPYQWSMTRDGAASAFGFGFGYGTLCSGVLTDQENVRVLCVRRVVDGIAFRGSYPFDGPDA